MSKLQKLRDAGVAHPTHEFSDDERSLVESLSDEEVDTLIRVKGKMGHRLAAKQADGDGDVHPSTFVL